MMAKLINSTHNALDSIKINCFLLALYIHCTEKCCGHILCTNCLYNELFLRNVIVNGSGDADRHVLQLCVYFIHVV
jgi:hypothetical protein